MSRGDIEARGKAKFALSQWFPWPRSRKKMRRKIIVSVWNIYQCSVRSSKSIKVEHDFSNGCRQYKQHRSNKMIESKNLSQWVHYWRYPYSFAVLLHRIVTELTIASVTLTRPNNQLMVQKWAHSPLLTHRTRQSSGNQSHADIPHLLSFFSNVWGSEYTINSFEIFRE